MKRFVVVVMLAVPCLCAGAIDYDTFEAEVVVTDAQIKAFTGQANVSYSTMAVGPDGRLYVYTREGAADPNARLLAIDVTGPSPAFTTIATEAHLLPFLDSAGPHTFNMGVDNSGTVYWQEFVLTGQIDDILKIVPGHPPTVSNLRRINGIAGVTLNQAQDALYIAQVDNYLAPSNNFVRISTSGGADMVVASNATIAVATGGSQAGLLCSVVETSAGNFLAWDEATFDGTDQLIQITPAGVVTVVRTTAGWDSGVTGTVLAMGIDQFDTLFAWNMFPSVGGPKLHIIPNAGTGTPIVFPAASIDAALSAAVGSSYAYAMNSFGNGMEVYSTATETVLYLVNPSQGDIVSLTFTDPLATAAAQGWEGYQ